MSDVEKYGLVAVVFVGGLLLVIATQGGFGGGDAQALAPEVIDTATPLRAPAPKTGGENTVRVVSVLPDTPFHWDEPPVPYPGRRSVGLPGAGADDAAGVPSSLPLSGPKVAASPALPDAAAAATPRALPGTHTIAKGETLETVADKYLGSKTRWRELLPLNPGLDPKKLQIGQVLRVSAGQPSAPLAAAPAPNPPAPVPAPPSTSSPLAKPAPAASTAAATSTSKGRTHTVVKGDTLGAIAKKYLGSSARADEIFKANTGVLKSMDDLAVGQVLRIP